VIPGVRGSFLLMSSNVAADEYFLRIHVGKVSSTPRLEHAKKVVSSDNQHSLLPVLMNSNIKRTERIICDVRFATSRSK
jgi:hypothetical protein